MFGSAVASQVVLSAASFVVGILMVRRTSEAEYGAYVLIIGAVILATSLQYAFIGPAMVNRMAHLDPRRCGELTGGLFREQRFVVGLLGLGMVLGIGVLWLLQRIEAPTALMLLAATLAVAGTLYREYFRMVLHAYRRAFAVLRMDLLYVAVLVAGALVATKTGLPAAAVAVVLAAAAVVAAFMLFASLRGVAEWDSGGMPGILWHIAPLATWSTAGAAIHWTVSQGYAVLAAATLDLTAVAAIAATRMLAMPVSLLSAGIGSLMLPLTARWLADNGALPTLRRLVGIGIGLALASVAYFGLLWLGRDWVFGTVLQKDFAQSDTLLLLWAASFVVLAFNQQLLWLLVARSRFRALTVLALVSALVALSCSYLAMLHMGGAGAPLGILIGELISTAGIAALCWRELGLAPHRQAVAYPAAS